MVRFFFPIGLVALGLVLGMIPGQAQSAVERETFDLVNQYRTSEGLDALKWSNAMAAIARGHSRDMASGKVDFGHEGFGARVESLKSAWPGLRGCGENVLMTSDPRNVARSAVALWLRSPPHRHNIRGAFNWSGIGVGESADGVIYFTQIFMRLPPPGPAEP